MIRHSVIAILGAIIGSATFAAAALAQCSGDINAGCSQVLAVQGVPLAFSGANMRFDMFPSGAIYPGVGPNGTLSITNTGASTGADDGQTMIRLFGYGSADIGVEGWQHNGTIALPTHTTAGQMLVKVGGMGYATNGTIQNDVGGIWLWADQDFSNTGSSPDYANTAAGGNLGLYSTPDGANSQQMVALVDQSGAFALGAWANSGNNFPANADGWLVLKNSNGGVGPFPGAIGLHSYNGALQVRLPGSGGEQPLVLQTGGVTHGHHACWSAWGVIGDCGS